MDNNLKGQDMEYIKILLFDLGSQNKDCFGRIAPIGYFAPEKVKSENSFFKI